MMHLDHITAAQRLNSVREWTTTDTLLCAALVLIVLVLTTVIVNANERRTEMQSLLDQARESIESQREVCRTYVLDGIPIEHCIRKAGF